MAGAGNTAERAAQARDFDPRIGYPLSGAITRVQVTRGNYLADKQAAIVEERKFSASKIGKNWTVRNGP